MRTLAEPKQNIAKLWGKQAVKPEETYRLMRYVLRVDHEGKTALHNVVTGQLIVLDADEVQAVDALPTGYAPAMDALIADHYLVPEAYDEHKQVVNLRTILRSLMPKPKYITHYTILPTTACNARCYYCFEQGIKPVTMTEETADQVVKFIAEHCGPEKKIHIRWFGGEPTVAAQRIDQICLGLQARGISFITDMQSNGYLFSKAMVEKAKSLWHLSAIQIVIDGLEENYNKIKAFVNAEVNPYERVMQNVGLLLREQIRVTVRMNFDIKNYQDFYALVQELKNRYPATRLLTVNAHPIHGQYIDHDREICHGTEIWFQEKQSELNLFAHQSGLQRWNGQLVCLDYSDCRATTDAALVITPTGRIVKCPEQIDDEQIVGTVVDGITNVDLINDWKQFADYPRCAECVLFPHCKKVKHCQAKERCVCKQKDLCTVKDSIRSFAQQVQQHS